MKANFIINPDDKFYPEADAWMWDYCIFLGKFTDSKGENYDLGIHKRMSVFEGELWVDISDATVYGPEGGNYSSGPLRKRDMEQDLANGFVCERRIEVVRRAKLLNIIPKDY
jgi:hypothetical protein